MACRVNLKYTKVETNFHHAKYGVIQKELHTFKITILSQPDYRNMWFACRLCQELHLVVLFLTAMRK